MCKARVERSFDVQIRLQSAADPMDWNTGAALHSLPIVVRSVGDFLLLA